MQRPKRLICEIDRIPLEGSNERFRDDLCRTLPLRDPRDRASPTELFRGLDFYCLCGRAGELFAVRLFSNSPGRRRKLTEIFADQAGCPEL